MSKKDDLKGGLSALLGGAPRHLDVEPVGEPYQRTDEPQQLESTIKDEELRAALEARRKLGRGRPRTAADGHGKRSDGYSRTSLIVNEAKYAKVKEIAFRETLTTKEIVEAALDLLIEKYESAHGEVVPNPERYKGDVSKLFG